MKKLAVAVLALGMIGAASAADFQIEEATVEQLQTQMSGGKLTSRALVEHYLMRIEALDRHGPKLNAIIELNPDARVIADALDQERAAQQVRGPLHGIPVLIKDNIDTADNMLTTAGSLALIASKPAKDAFIVSRLRAAGAVILGKTNLSEWANMRSQHSTSGWSARGGLSHNAYDPTRSPCGSSSGSGAAAAANFAAITVGTETDGSIVCPSAINGIVGFKPTVGLVSRSGIIPISATQDTAGPMTRTVADAAVLLQVLAGEDQADSATGAIQQHAVPDYVAAVKGASLRGVRLGIARNLAGFQEPVDAVFEQAVHALKAAGAEIVDPVTLESGKFANDDENIVLEYEFKDGLNRYLASRSPGPRNLEELIAFNQRERALELPHFGQDIFESTQKRGSLTAPEYRTALERGRRAAGRDGIDKLLKAQKLDAIVAPTVGLAWTQDLVNGDHYNGGGASQYAAMAGYPHLTVPAGYARELPVGISFIGTAWSDARLLAIGAAFEQATHARRSPAMQP